MKFNFCNARWDEATTLSSRTFDCWNCGESVASNKGFATKYPNNNGALHTAELIYICHYCQAPNLRDLEDRVVLSSLPGKCIKKMPDDINSIYNEARSCISVGAYTAAVMLFRKILMNLAVEHGADEGKSFASYVDFLCDDGLVHKRQKNQADKVRLMGNGANHKIENKTKEEAEELLKFMEFLLLNNYEFADEEETPHEQ